MSCRPVWPRGAVSRCGTWAWCSFRGPPWAWCWRCPTRTTASRSGLRRAPLACRRPPNAAPRPSGGWSTQGGCRCWQVQLRLRAPHARLGVFPFRRRRSQRQAQFPGRSSGAGNRAATNRSGRRRGRHRSTTADAADRGGHGTSGHRQHRCPKYRPSPQRRAAPTADRRADHRPGPGQTLACQPHRSTRAPSVHPSHRDASGAADQTAGHHPRAANQHQTPHRRQPSAGHPAATEPAGQRPHQAAQTATSHQPDAQPDAAAATGPGTGGPRRRSRTPPRARRSPTARRRRRTPPS